MSTALIERPPASDPRRAFAPSEIEVFLLHEAALLDEKRFPEWMALFADDGTYWVPAQPKQESPFTTASLFYDDRTLMGTRITRLQHPHIHIQTPASRTMHQVGRPLMESGDDEAEGECLVSSTVLMVEYRDDQQRIFAGRQYHRLRKEGDGFLIVQKRVDLVNSETVFEPIAIPI